MVDASASDDTSSEPPVADTHDAVEMEALLPTLVSGSTLQTQSWTGDTILGDDTFSTAMTKFLTDAGKKSQDMRVAQAYDPTQTLDITVTAYRVPGVKAAAIRDALIAAWKVDYPDLKVTTVHAGRQGAHQGGLRPGRDRELPVPPGRRRVRHRDR